MMNKLILQINSHGLSSRPMPTVRQPAMITGRVIFT